MLTDNYNMWPKCCMGRWHVVVAGHISITWPYVVLYWALLYRLKLQSYTHIALQVTSAAFVNINYYYRSIALPIPVWQMHQCFYVWNVNIPTELIFCFWFRNSYHGSIYEWNYKSLTWLCVSLCEAHKLYYENSSVTIFNYMTASRRDEKYSHILWHLISICPLLTENNRQSKWSWIIFCGWI